MDTNGNLPMQNTMPQTPAPGVLPQAPTVNNIQVTAPTANQASDIKNVFQYGSSGTEIYGGQFSEEYLGELLGTRAADVYDKMRRSESQVAMLLNAIYNPIKSANWDIEAANQSDPMALKQAEFIKYQLLENMPRGFQGFLQEALSFIPFGYSVFEIVHNAVPFHPVWGTHNGLAALGFRQQKTIQRWKLEKKTGKLIAIEQIINNDISKNAVIPGKFLMVFSLSREGDNYEGISALRPMYGAWKRKQLYLKLAAIGVEKYAYGIPTGTVPPGKEKTPEFTAFVETMRAYVANEKSFLVKPQGWDIQIIKEAFDADKIVRLLQFENTEMINAMVANFLALGTGGNGGAYALGQDLSDFFLGGIKSYADLVCEEINRVLIPNLIKLNFGPQSKYPVLKCTGINDKAGKELADVVKVLVDGKVVKADDKLEEFMRKAFDLPKADPLTAREAPAPTPFGNPAAPVSPSLSASPAPVTKLSEAHETAKLSENRKKYLAQWDDGKALLKETMQKGLKTIANDMVEELRKRWKKSTDTDYIKATNGLEPKGVQIYTGNIKNVLTSIVVDALQLAKTEVPNKKNVKLFEEVEALKFSDYDKLPKFLRDLLDAASKKMETQVNDVTKLVVFQYGNSAPSTNDFDVIEKDIDDRVDAYLEGSTASGASIDAAAGNLTSEVTQQARNEFFFSPEVLPTIESFTFTNEDPVSPICQDLAGTTFDANDPEAERYFPPLHHNCKSRLVPNIVGDKGNPEIDGSLKPSRASLDKYITLEETIKLGGPGSGRKPGSGAGKNKNLPSGINHNPGIEKIDVGNSDGMVDLTPEQVAIAKDKLGTLPSAAYRPIATPEQDLARNNDLEKATRDRAKNKQKPTLKVDAEHKKIAEGMTLDAMDGKEITITNDFEHKVAERLVANKMATVVSKKNYGRIAKIKGIRS